MALTDGLVGAYKLGDELDYSGLGNDLTNVGSTTFSSGLIGNAAILGNSNTTKNLRTADALGILKTDDWTVSLFWKAPTTYNLNLAAFDMRYGTSGSGNNNRFIFIRDHANNRWSMFNSSFSNSFTTESITAGTWYNLIFQKSGSTATFFVNTVSKASRTTGANTNLSPLGFSLNGADLAWTCSGDVDLLYIWNRAIDSTERSEMYNGGAGYEIPIGGGGGVTPNAIAFAGGL